MLCVESYVTSSFHVFFFFLFASVSSSLFFLLSSVLLVLRTKNLSWTFSCRPTQLHDAVVGKSTRLPILILFTYLRVAPSVLHRKNLWKVEKFFGIYTNEWEMTCKVRGDTNHERMWTCVSFCRFFDIG